MPTHSPGGSHGSSGDTAPSKFKSISSVTHVIRDMYLGCLSGYVGATSDITMGRVINSMMQVQDIDMSEGTVEASSDDANEQWEHLSPKSASTTSGGPKGNIELGQVPDAIAAKLFRGYIHHISTRWPALHSPFLRQLHQKRASLTDVFE